MSARLRFFKSGIEFAMGFPQVQRGTKKVPGFDAESSGRRRDPY